MNKLEVKDYIEKVLTNEDDCEAFENLQCIRFFTNERNIEDFQSDLKRLKYVINRYDEMCYIYLNENKMYEIDLNIIFATRFYYDSSDNIRTIEVRIHES